ncbi:MAG: class I adenylate-forming enzyme family protein [Phycisphaerales bacterium]
MSVHWPIIRACLARPTRRAAIDDDRAWRAVELVVGALHLAAEIEPRCRSATLGVLLPTTGAFPLAALAGWMLGKTVVPLNYLLKPEELAFVVQDCETDTVVTAGPMVDFIGARPDVPNLLELDKLRHRFRGVPEPRWPATAGDDDLAVLLYTSGTSGRPKGVRLTHGNLSSNLRQITAHVDFTRRDRLLGVLPQFHSFGLTVLTLLPLTIGCPVVYSARFVPHKIVGLIREHRPTVFIAIPSMYNALLHVKDAKPEDFASLRYIVSGGEPLPEAVFNGFRERFGVTINEGYGLTETSPVTNWCRPNEWRPRSVGPALPGIDQRIVDPATGRVLGPNQDGEVRMKGPNIMSGYFKRPDESAAVFDELGYFKTGDMGRLDDDRHLFITGRIKEMIIVGGENVFPREIEEILNQHPTVGASGVIGQMDPMRGELPVAFVEPKEGQTPDPKALITWCRERLAGYKVPRSVHVVEKLPRNPTGKIVRRELKKLLTKPGAD